MTINEAVKNLRDANERHVVAALAREEASKIHIAACNEDNMAVTAHLQAQKDLIDSVIAGK